MRRILSTLMVLTNSLVLFCCTKNVAHVSDEDVAEAVFRFQIERCYEHNQPKVYFMSLKGNDPSSEFMARFKSEKPLLRKRSQMTGEFSDPESGERGIAISVDKLTQIGETEFQVEGACVAGGLNGHGFIYSVKREHGEWKVGSRETWISDTMPNKLLHRTAR